MKQQTVTQTQTQTMPAPLIRGGLLQRKCACGQHTVAGGECAECRKKRLALQRRATNQAEPTTAPPIVHEVLRSPGQPLDAKTRAFMEPRFGHDFSQVRVHIDGKAAESARAVKALAYTVGQDVVFGSGRYLPHTMTGRRLLAHELTHTLQQEQAMENRPQAKLTIGNSGDMAECEADRIAAAVVSDITQVPDSFTSSSPTVQRACGSRAIGTPTGCTPSSPVFVTNSPLFKFNVNCDEFAAGQDMALISFARALPATATLEIHGFASVDGPVSFNHNLACARALAAESLLTNPGPIGGGISTSRITGIFNHGPTPGPAADRRSIVVPTTTPPPPPCIPPPCPSPPPGHQLRNPGIPSGALCRGACGADCDPDACTAQPNLVLCLSDPSGRCHRICTYDVLECGSHPGCIIHDDCYDACAAAGETDLCHEGGTCHCRCDAACIAVFDTITCGLWATGRGPQPVRLRFTDPPVDSGPISGSCPP